MILSLGISLFYAAIFSIFRYPIVSLFNTDPGVIEVGAMLFVTLITVHTINSIPQILTAVLRGMGKSLAPTVNMIACYVGLRQAYIHILWQKQQSIMTVVGSYHFSWTICAVLMIGLYYYYKKRVLKQKIDS